MIPRQGVDITPRMLLDRATMVRAISAFSCSVVIR